MQQIEFLQEPGERYRTPASRVNRDIEAAAEFSHGRYDVISFNGCYHDFLQPVLGLLARAAICSVSSESRRIRSLMAVWRNARQ